MENLFFTRPGQIALAFLLDCLLGDPENFFHPVRVMGNVIARIECWLRAQLQNHRLAGMGLAASVVLLVGFVTWLTLFVANAISPILGALIDIYFFYACLSVRSLAAEVQRVLDALGAGSLPDARRSLARIVGRDTQDLSEEAIVRASIETTAESTVDGIISVLFYAFLGGPVMAMVFKAVSTLDSMVGYKNDRFREMGWASAKLDDAMNYIPARLSAPIIALAAFCMHRSFMKTLQVVARDAKNQPSPNSGFPEAAFAGALSIQLGGENFYQGKRVWKATMGDALQPLNRQVALASLHLMKSSALLALFFGLVIWLVCRVALAITSV